MASGGSHPASLRRRMVLWLLLFTAVVSLLVFAIGIRVHEQAEHAAWRSLLGSELDAIEANAAHDLGRRWQDVLGLRPPLATRIDHRMRMNVFFGKWLEYLGEQGHGPLTIRPLDDLAVVA